MKKAQIENNKGRVVTDNRMRIIIDWGTTSFRAFLVTADQSILDSRQSKNGIWFIADNQFETTLMQELDNWFTHYGALPVYALGMVTSRNGWVEVPYVPCPTDLATLARGVVRRSLKNGATLIFIPGIQNCAAYPFPDVMRGEETQLIGFGLERDLVVVLPGTHSKWARICHHRIENFQTFATGELYSLLADYSFIAKIKNNYIDNDWSAFDRGIDTVVAGGANTLAMLSMLFSARTGMLAGEISIDQIHSYISGLLIAFEFYQARQCGWHVSGDAIGLVGDDSLMTRYLRCADVFGLSVICGPKDAALRGTFTIADLITKVHHGSS